jgi:hypothetical protein
MKKMKKANVIKKLVNYGLITLIGFNLFGGCVKLVPDLTDEYHVNFQMGLPLDLNGYYHLSLDRNEWQTLHRVSGVVTDQDDNFVESFWVEWESNLYWYLGDNSSYIVHYGYTNTWVQVAFDTTYITAFTGLEVPTSNSISYSNGYGQVNNMIAPTKSMIGDTLTLKARWYDGGENTFNIVLD